MSNILKVSTPMTGYDNAVNKQTAQPQESINIKNPVNPNKVIRPDGRSNTDAEQGVRKGISYESNFGNFIQSLRETPRLAEIMSKLMFTRMGSLVEAGIGQGTAAEINALMQMLEMKPEDLKAFLKNQMSGANRLQGQMFSLLRQVMDGAATVELRGSILEFLKKYNDLSSGKHLLKNINDLLKEIQGYMFRRDAGQLQKLAGQLRPYSQGSHAGNVQTLKEQIIPFLGKYISDTRDMGKIRDLINLLTYNTSRYENGSLDGLMQAFRRLNDFPSFRQAFKGLDEAALRQMMQNVDFDRAAGKAEWSDRLLNILNDGIRGNAGLENRENFMNILRSVLINESVYMPVLHTMLPMIVNGTPIFSELWVDPDDQSGAGIDGESGVKLLLKFDMKDVGFFDVLLYYGQGKVDLLLRYPDGLSDKEPEIRAGLTDILRRNHMEINYLSLEKSKESIPISAAFPKIYERRNAVNVTI